jgi:hypothetical protein
VLSPLKWTAKRNLELTLCTSTFCSSLLKDTCCGAGLRRDATVIVVVSSSSSSPSYTLIVLRSHYLNFMFQPLPLLVTFPLQQSLYGPSQQISLSPTQQSVCELIRLPGKYGLCGKSCCQIGWHNSRLDPTGCIQHLRPHCFLWRTLVPHLW